VAVPEHLRTESKVEFLSNFHKLRKELYMLMARDFGLKPRSYDVELLKDIYKISDEDKTKLDEISAKYGMKSYIVKKIPDWMVVNWRNDMSTLIRNASTEIELANSIYVTMQEEYTERRLHWEKSIGYLCAIKDMLQEIIDIIKPQLGAYTEISKLLEKEIRLIKGVRKSDKSFLNK